MKYSILHIIFSAYVFSPQTSPLDRCCVLILRFLEFPSLQSSQPPTNCGNVIVQVLMWNFVVRELERCSCVAAEQKPQFQCLPDFPRCLLHSNTGSDLLFSFYQSSEQFYLFPAFPWPLLVLLTANTFETEEIGTWTHLSSSSSTCLIFTKPLYMYIQNKLMHFYKQLSVW